jgi:hypothetical protein
LSSKSVAHAPLPFLEERRGRLPVFGGYRKGGALVDEAVQGEEVVEREEEGEAGVLVLGIFSFLCRGHEGGLGLGLGLQHD